jgi:hypothetical protein
MGEQGSGYMILWEIREERAPKENSGLLESDATSKRATRERLPQRSE